MKTKKLELFICKSCKTVVEDGWVKPFITFAAEKFGPNYCPVNKSTHHKGSEKKFISMPKPKRRYTHQGQIEVDIAAAKQKATDLLRSADSLETIAKEHFQLAEINSSEWMREQGVEEMQKAHAARVTATNILEGKINKLSGKLAELNTMTIPGLLQDESVEA